jgi:hypothetical protein
VRGRRERRGRGGERRRLLRGRDAKSKGRDGGCAGFGCRYDNVEFREGS